MGLLRELTVADILDALTTGSSSLNGFVSHCPSWFSHYSHPSRKSIPLSRGPQKQSSFQPPNKILCHKILGYHGYVVWALDPSAFTDHNTAFFFGLPFGIAGRLQFSQMRWQRLTPQQCGKRRRINRYREPWNSVLRRVKVVTGYYWDLASWHPQIMYKAWSLARSFMTKVFVDMFT